MPSNHLILCRPLLLPPSIFSSIRVFSNESVLPIRWPKYWSFSFRSSNKYSGLISFRMDWLGLLAVHRTLKSLLKHHSLKASSILLHSTIVLPFPESHRTGIMHSVRAKSLSRVRLFGTPRAVARQTPPSMGCSGQEYWSGWPFPPPGDLPDPGIKPESLASPVLAAGSLP